MSVFLKSGSHSLGSTTTHWSSVGELLWVISLRISARNNSAKQYGAAGAQCVIAIASSTSTSICDTDLHISSRQQQQAATATHGQGLVLTRLRDSFASP